MKKILLVLLATAFCTTATAVDRFPRPQFETEYEMPVTTTPAAGTVAVEWIDVAALAFALVVSSVIALKVRRRRAMWIFAILCLAYFGFVRKGCVCSVGSVQNVAASIGDSSFPVALPVLLFFLLPLLTALLVGRTFCSSVCPLGAIQDVVTLKPLKLPLWLAAALEMIACTYLGVAVLMAATGGGFLICRYDPFVGFFRMSGPTHMIIAGIAVLAVGMFVARPYCRFICPYGVLLRLVSPLAAKHLTIAPDKCIDCRLCSKACPFGAILAPTPEKADESRGASVRRMGLSLVLIPLLVAGGIAVGSVVAPRMASLHPTVALAAQLRFEEANPDADSTLETDAFRATQMPVGDVYEQARNVRKQFRVGMGIVGAFVGGLFAWQMFGLATRRRRTEYVPDKGRCFSCARCVEFCPREHARRKGGPA